MYIYYLFLEKSSFFLFQLYFRIYLWIKPFITIERKSLIEEPSNLTTWKYEGILYKTQKMKHEYQEYSSSISMYIHDIDIHSKVETEVTEQLVIIKRDNYYYTNRLVYPSAFLSLSSKLSTISFFLIEYKHPKIQNEIQLSLPREMMIIGNCLFSPAFVLRLLEHQSEIFWFDFDYQLVLVDNSLVSITLDAHHYIHLYENNYEIKNI